jgi:hypothetical protein
MKTVIVLAIATLKYRITVINVGKIRRGCMVDVFTLHMQSVCLTTNVVNLNPVACIYIKHKFRTFCIRNSQHRKCDISSVDKAFHHAILWFWVLIEVSSKLQCYLVMDPIKHFWYLIRVELL